MGRSFLIFENAVRSKHTLRVYKLQMRMFLKFSKMKDYDSLANLDMDATQSLLENYIIHLRDIGIKPITIRNYLSGPQLFFDMNRKLYYKKILQKMIPTQTKEGNDMPYTTEDIQKMLSCIASKRIRAMIHFFASTGARINVVADPVLRFRHIHPMPQGCKAVLLYEGSKEEYWAFLTPEAVNALDEYVNERIRDGETITPESPVFVRDRPPGLTNPEHLGTMAVSQRLFHQFKKAGIVKTKSGNRYDKAITYGFRKRFNTILKMNNNINSNVAEKLMAHKRGLDGVYFKPTREQCFAEFVKAIPDLTISNEIRKDRVIQDLKREHVTMSGKAELETEDNDVFVVTFVDGIK